MKKKSIYLTFLIILTVLTVILNTAACFRGFCDLYTETVYMKITDITGWIFGLLPVAAGEIIMYAGAILLAAAVIILILLVFLRKKERYRKFIKGYFRSLLMILVCFIFIYTVNWIIPMRTTPLSPGSGDKRKYTVEELQILRNYFVDNLNLLCEEVQRDENGVLIIPENRQELTVQAMKDLSSSYHLLDGYYPPPKPALCSAVLDWMHIGGFTYPYTKEVQYNKYDALIAYPSLIAHEYSHYRGYFRENEGEFIGFRACDSSSDPFIRYSGYIQTAGYITRAYINSLENVCENSDEADRILREQPPIDNRVFDDIDASIAQADEKMASEVPKEVETVFQPAADKAAQTGWNTQKKILGEASYDGVTELLLMYYDGILY